MGFRKRIIQVSLATAVSVLPSLEAREERAPEAKDLVGLWRAKRHSDPEVKGSLTIQRDGPGFRAEIQGRAAPVKLDHDRLFFELAGGEGSFRGCLTKNLIVGQRVRDCRVIYGAWGQVCTIYLHRLPLHGGWGVTPWAWAGEARRRRSLPRSRP